MDIYKLLADNNIEFQRYDHPAVFTCEEAKSLAPEMPGVNTKSLFLRDKKAQQIIMLVVGHDKAVDLKLLTDEQHLPRLSFGSAERLQQTLGIEPGSVSLLALANDTERKVKVLIDQELAQADALCCHPLVNTSTLVITNEGIRRFLNATGHSYSFIPVPARKCCLVQSN